MAPPLTWLIFFAVSDAVPAIVQEAFKTLPNLQTIWMQIGVSHAEAAAIAFGPGSGRDPEPMSEN